MWLWLECARVIPHIPLISTVTATPHPSITTLTWSRKAKSAMPGSGSERPPIFRKYKMSTLIWSKHFPAENISPDFGHTLLIKVYQQSLEGVVSSELEWNKQVFGQNYYRWFIQWDFGRFSFYWHWWGWKELMLSWPMIVCWQVCNNLKWQRWLVVTIAHISIRQ